MRRQRAQRRNRVVPFGVRRDTVRFVDDHDVPAAGERRRQNLRTLHVVDRCDRDRHGRPGVDAHGQLRRAASGLAHVDDRGVDAESVAKLPGPLLEQAGRRENQDAVHGASRHELGDDQAGLDGLPEPDFIRDEHPRAEAENHRQGRFELVRQQVDSRPQRRSQHARGSVLGDERTAQTTPAAKAHDAKTSRPFQRFDAVERGDDPSFDAGVVRADSREGYDGASVVGTQRGYPPALPPDPWAVR